MSLTLQELKRAGLYAALVGLLTAIVLLGDATLARTDSQGTPTPTATPALVWLPPTFRTGLYVDQFGETVQVDARRITYYARDNHGNEWIGLGNRRYYRTAGGALYRAEQ
jgi:hypothetical protein